MEKKFETFKHKEEILADKIETMKGNKKEFRSLKKTWARGRSKTSVNPLRLDIIRDNIIRSSEELMLTKIKTIKREIKALERRKEKVSLSKGDIRNVTLYREPEIERFIPGQKKWVYPAKGMIVGLIIGLFAVSSIESWSKYKSGL
ncbi:MAG: hypothetical protein ABH844_04575 [Candidatus Omnitrophota bacterium]